MSSFREMGAARGEAAWKRIFATPFAEWQGVIDAEFAALRQAAIELDATEEEVGEFLSGFDSVTTRIKRQIALAPIQRGSRDRPN